MPVVTYQEALAKQAETPLCCFHINPKKGCKLPPGPGRQQCAHNHFEDDGVTPCHFGATCKYGHANRVLPVSVEERDKFWTAFHAQKGYSGKKPADRDATLIQTQIECWTTPQLKLRLEKDFGYDSAKVLTMQHSQIVDAILQEHAKGGRYARRTIRAQGSPVRAELLHLIQREMEQWSKGHSQNDRPAINASSYTILRSPAEFTMKDSNAAKMAAKKLEQHRTLWDLAIQAMMEVDPIFAEKFTALALTKNFKGSPHIDRQNTGPFYGLSLGTFPDGEGGVCVECDAFTVAHVNTKNRLAKVDGRFPHWVAPYDESCDRYSLIYYQTDGGYQTPTVAHWGLPVEQA